MKTAANHTLLVVLLAALTSVTPLAVDTYLPSMPEIAAFLHVGIEKVEVTVSIFLLFFAMGQLAGGTLSDRYGRRRTALIGLGIYILANFALYRTATLEWLYFFRAVQAFSGGMAIVNSAATVRDRFHGSEAAKVFSAIASITMIAPMVAPGLGALIISCFPWQVVFLFLSLYAALVWLLLFFKFPETGTPTRTAVFAAYRRVLTHTRARGYILGLSFGFSGMFIFIEKSSFVYMEHFGASQSLFPLLFGANVALMILLTRLNIKLVRRYSPHELMQTGLYIQLAAGAALLTLAWQDAPMLPVFAAMTLYVGILGIIFGNGVASALEYFQHESGIASSVIGVTEFTLAGAVGFAASAIHTGTLLPVFALMSATSLAAVVALRSGKETRS